MVQCKCSFGESALPFHIQIQLISSQRRILWPTSHAKTEPLCVAAVLDHQALPLRLEKNQPKRISGKPSPTPPVGLSRCCFSVGQERFRWNMIYGCDWNVIGKPLACQNPRETKRRCACHVQLGDDSQST